VFTGSATGHDAVYRDAAITLGRLLADRRIELVYGGGRVGLMGVIADAVMGAGGTVIGVDWRIHLDEAWAMVGHHVAVQGNLDPVVLFAPLHEIERRVADILKRAGNRPGHIFNLGHGILQHTPVDHVAAAAEFVHKLSQR